VAGSELGARALTGPFPAFVDYPQSLDDERRWDAALVEARSTRARASQAELSLAGKLLTRAAALDRVAYEFAALGDESRGPSQPDNAALEKVEASVVAGEELIATLASNRSALSEGAIARLHRSTTDTFAGDTAPTRYRTGRMFVSQLVGAPRECVPPGLVSSEMRRLLHELNSREFSDAHPVIQAAYAHYGFVTVHPFDDRNGRTARALASIYLHRSAGVSLLTFIDQRLDYYQALRAAHDGNHHPFVSFVYGDALACIALAQEALSVAVAATRQSAHRPMAATARDR